VAHFYRKKTCGVSSHQFTTITPRFTIQNTTLRNHNSAKTPAKHHTRHARKKSCT